MKKSLKNTKFIIFDLDGIFYRGENPINGGKELIDFCKNNNIGYCFLTNNSSYPLITYKEKLLACGVEAELEQIVTTTMLLQDYLSKQSSHKIYVIGSSYLKKTLYKHFIKTPNNPDTLVLGMDENLTLLEISQTINLIGKNTNIVAANPDELIPKQYGYDLECGIIIDIVKKITKKEILIVGKPNNYAYNYIFKKFNIKAEDTIMIGDTYNTDILGAINHDITAVWIATGNSLPKNIKNDNFLRLKSLFHLKEKLLTN